MHRGDIRPAGPGGQPAWPVPSGSTVAAVAAACQWTRRAKSVRFGQNTTKKGLQAIESFWTSVAIQVIAVSAIAVTLTHRSRSFVTMFSRIGTILSLLLIPACR